MGKGSRLRKERAAQRAAEAKSGPDQRKTVVELTAEERARRAFIESVDGAIKEMAKNIWETAMQFSIEMMSLALNDKEIMKKDVFGSKRLERVMKGFMRYHAKFLPALQVGDYAVCAQDGMNQRLTLIYKTIEPFEERYPFAVSIQKEFEKEKAKP